MEFLAGEKHTEEAPIERIRPPATKHLRGSVVVMRLIVHPGFYGPGTCAPLQRRVHGRDSRVGLCT